jgi:hypothetical protein
MRVSTKHPSRRAPPPLRLYIPFRGLVYRSDDRGSHWARTAFVNVAMDANDDFRGWPKDGGRPSQSERSLCGTPEIGVFVTTDGGSRF